MQSKREYAASLGLAKLGARGKLSKEAHAAINKAIADGVNFSDPSKAVDGKSNIKPIVSTSSSNSTAPDARQEWAGLADQPKTHAYNTVWGICIKGRSALPIAFQYCAKCLKQVSYCSHDVPQLPHWVGGGNGLLEKPAV